jgi:sialate O-acetylesterase
MIKPLTHYKIAGVIWYQGETNTQTLSRMTFFLNIDRRLAGKVGYTFPFYFVQLAPWMYGREYEGVLLQDAQRKAMKVPFTGMVVTNDVGNPKDLHPKKKKEVGDRLALWALYHTYNLHQLEFSGPIYQTFQREGHSIRIYFEFTGDGLISKKNPISDFVIAGSNKKFVQANASIEGHTIVVSSSAVKKPVAVRFAWSNGCEPGLFNSSGLPASCFRTDEWKIKGY